MLLPTATNGIPRELIDTTTSLISQSRHKISTLNPTEEPAREMICAHIACQRLKLKLDLPQVPDKPPAPVPPRVYKMLFKQFSETLVLNQSQTPTGTPSKRTRGVAGTSSATTPSKTPSGRHKSSLAQFLPSTPSTAANKKIEPYLPLIKDLCHDAPAAVPHVTAGLAFIHGSFKYSNLTEEPYILLGALYIIVIKQLSPQNEFRHLSVNKQREWYENQRRSVYKFMRRKGVVKMKEDEWDAKFAEVMEEVSSGDMAETRWFMEIPDGGGVISEGSDGEQEGEDAGNEIIEEGVTGKGKRKAAEVGMESGVGSMMQDRVDYLSDKRRKGFAEWKADVLRRIAKLES
ncbi:hypothetical protein ABW19_dt0203938 [Dactylella cylindrospora]|nr:hypothetical protein ABW19_dt0203938 [Dactylella cylindrospora]